MAAGAAEDSAEAEDLATEEVAGVASGVVAGAGADTEHQRKRI